MARASLVGQAALMSLVDDNDPASSSSSSSSSKPGETLESFVPPRRLRTDPSSTKHDLKTAHHGMDVYKISKNGKSQARRVALSPDNRTLLISTNRIQSVKGLVRMAKREVALSRCIDVSTIVRVQKGQQSRRFDLARSRSGSARTLSSSPGSDEPGTNCLSIVYRTSESSSSSSPFGLVDGSMSPFGSPGGGGSHKSGGDAGPFGVESLDLFVPSDDDYASLSGALDDVLRLYRESKRHVHPDVLLLQHHWIDMGKTTTTTTTGGEEDYVSLSDWVSLCKRLNSGVPKSVCSSLYKDYCDEMGVDHDEDIHPSEVVELLRRLKEWNMRSAGLDVERDEPCHRVWSTVRRDGDAERHQSSAAPVMSAGEGVEACDTTDSDGGAGGMMSAAEFLDFLRVHQKDTETTIDGVHNLFERLNEQAKSHKNGSSHHQDADDPNVPVDEDEAKFLQDFSREYISRATFAQYLVSDTNDVFDPYRGRRGQSYMSEPLSNYWINTSHDTYLAKSPPRWSGSNAAAMMTTRTELQSYTAALYRGVRCLELDVWDGAAGAQEPVVRSGKSSHFPNNNDAAVNTNHPPSPSRKSSSSQDVDSGIPFADVVRSVHSFLLSEPQSYPIILSIENHCTVPCQNRIAMHLQRILGSSGMMYVPPGGQQSGAMDGPLPSPESLRGKVVVKCKRPERIVEGATIVNDDFDDENDYDPRPPADAASRGGMNYADDDESDDGERVPENVVGFSSSGYILSNMTSMPPKSPDELLSIARWEAQEAKKEATDGEARAFDMQVQANQAEERSKMLLGKLGMTYEALKRKRDVGPDAGDSSVLFDGEGTEVEIVADSRNGVKVNDVEEQGLEVQDFFSDSVDEAQHAYQIAESHARTEAGSYGVVLADLEKKKAALADAEDALRNALQRKKDLAVASDRATLEARANREHANTAKQRIAAVEELVVKGFDLAATSESVAATAVTEANISEERAAEAETRAARAQAIAEDDRNKADVATNRQDDLENEAASLQKKYAESGVSVKVAREKIDRAAAMIEKINGQIKVLERNPELERKDSQDRSAAVQGEGLMPSDEKNSGKLLSEYNTRMDEKKSYTEKLKEASEENMQAETKRKKLKKEMEDLARIVKKQAQVAASARRKADHSTSIAEQLEEHAEEEREAADLRKVACENAELSVQRSEANRSSVEAQFEEAQRAAREADDLASQSRIRAQQLEKEAEKAKDVIKYQQKVRELREEKDFAQAAHDSAKAAKDDADEKAADAKRLLDVSTEVLARAQREAASARHRANLARQEEMNAMTAHENAVSLRRKAEEARLQAVTAVSKAADKVSAVKHAERYRTKRARVKPVSTSMASLTLLHSTKFGYWEKSMTLPFSHMHSVSEGKMLKLAERGTMEWRRWAEFNKCHLTRIFPSRNDYFRSSSSNYNPVLPWAMGCQLVGLNAHSCDEHLLLNDGRFRENGSCGYVLKPEHLTESGGQSSGERLDIDGAYPRGWNVRVLGGYNLPKPEQSGGRKGVPGRSSNPRVKVVLYDGSPKSFDSPSVHITKTVQSNGLNPVWNEKIGAHFVVLSPSVAIVLISVWDHNEEAGTEQFIAAAAVPISCLREGYRSVALFDSNHTRNGPHGLAYLLLQVSLKD